MATKVQMPSLLRGLFLVLPYSIIILFYWTNLWQLMVRIATDDHYSFGILVPFVIAYIIYLKWPQIRNSYLRFSWLGLPIILIGLTLNIFCELSAITFFAYLSLLLVIIGFLLLQGGGRLIRLLAFPLFLLLISFPLPGTLIKSITFRLQLLSSFLAARTLEAFGFAVFLQGNVLDLGVRQLQVAEACSGLGYLFSALVLGLIFCYFFQQRLWKALILLVSLIPISVFANVGRILSVAIFPVLQTGFWHMVFGLAIFILVFYYLTLLNRLLQKLGFSQGTPIETPAATLNENSHPCSPLKYYLYNLAGLALVILAFPVTAYLSQTQPVFLLHNFDNFPLTIGSWQGSRHYLEPETIKVLGTNQYLQANFVNPIHGSVSLWIAYYPSQFRDRALPHYPEFCLTGGGWKVVREEQTEIAPDLPAKYLLIEQDGKQYIVYYWYLQDNRWISDEYSLKMYLGLSLLSKRRNDGAFIRLITTAAPGTNKAQERLRLFALSLVPVLQQFFQIDKMQP